MASILFIKTSSLGDVIHHMPALTEARAQRPDAHFTWVVEETFAPLVKLHPAVDAVIPVAARRWRSALHHPATWREIGTFMRLLKAQVYDEIIDTQGLIRTALIAQQARGRSHGYDAESIKERPAAWLYDVKHEISRQQHAIERNRMLTAQALGYDVSGEPDYGLDRAKLAPPLRAPYGVLLHATARREKQWPEENWRVLAETLGRKIDLLVPYGTSEERARSARIAAEIERASVPAFQLLDAMARTIAGAAFVVGVDTGLLHLAAALGVPLVAIFSHSSPALTGPRGRGPIKLVSGAAGGMASAAEVAAAVEVVRPA